MAEVAGGVVGGESLGLSPEVEGVAGVSALEAVEGVLFEVDGKASAGGGGGAVQGAGAASLGGAGGSRRAAEQVEDGADGDGGADGGEVEGGAWSDSGLTLLLFVFGLAFLFASFAGLGELAVAFGVDGQVASFEAILGGDVIDGAVQADVVVMGDEVGDEASGVVGGEGHLGADAVALEGFVPAFDFAVGLGIVGRGAHVGHAGDADEFFEVLGDELRPVVGDDAWSDTWVTLAGALEDGGHVGFLHFLADFPVNEVAAATVEDRAEEVKSAGDVEIADIDVPVFVGLNGLHEAGACFGGRGGMAGQESGGLEDAIDAGRTAGRLVGVEHHESEQPIAFERMGAGKGADLFLFVGGEPMIAWHPGVVFVDVAVALAPIVEFAGADADPAEEV